MNEGPHILIDYVQGKNLVDRTFGRELYWSLQSARSYDNRSITPEESNRVTYFPKKILEEHLNRQTEPLDIPQKEGGTVKSSE